jgi:isopentenyldiphosphate isomerase
MSKEWLTVYNEEFKELGKKLRENVHRDGDWHEAVHCWFIEESEQGLYIYFQMRSYEKQDFPGQYDITAAGHIEHGEHIINAGIREIEEELGLKLRKSDLVYTGYYKSEYVTAQFTDREFCHLYFYKVTKKLYFAPGEEVEHMIKIKADEYMLLLKGELDTVPAIVIDKQENQLIAVTLNQFCPHEARYYHHVIEYARKL